jgi:hypothetical protein
MIGLPPFDAGGAKLIVAVLMPAVARPMTGAPGTNAGIIGAVGADAGPVPTALVAATVNV